MTCAVGHRDVEQFRALIADRLGLSFEESSLGRLADALRRRVQANDAAPASYLGQLAASTCPAQELRQLAQDLTVTETYFYRSVDQIRALVELALPQLLATSGAARKIRVLSAGCASGEEPYSLAIAIREQCPEASERVSIVAVDVNPAMLEKARGCRYNDWSLRELPQAIRSRWFRVDGGALRLDDRIRGAVTFQERNLAHGDPELWQPRFWDIVFCRNVLMYFDPSLAQAVVTRIARSLTPGGYLFLGHAETLRGVSNDFHLCHTHGSFYYRLREGPPEAQATVPARQPRAEDEPARFDDAATWVQTVRRAAQRIDALAELSHDLSSPPPVPAAPDLLPTLELLRGERFDQALAQLGALALEHARMPEALLLRAVSLVHAGALMLAEQACAELLELDDLNAGAHYVLALCREGLGDWAGAIEEDRVAVYLDAGFSMARLHMGLLARRRGEHAAARHELAQALLMLQQEDSARLLLFGGGFSRDALIALCRSELNQCTQRP